MKNILQLSWSLVSTFCGFISATSNFLLVKGISVRGFRKVGWYMDKNV